MAIELEWIGGERFRAVTPEGVELELDGGRTAGLSPTDALLVSLASCMGIDVVDILTKGRQSLRASRLRVEGERRDSPPRRFTRIRLEVLLIGSGLSRAKAERAVELSRTTYCSVWNTLAPDVELDVDLELREEAGPAPA
ncbi:MAG TPA: OsmC family protein [Gemmatimonadota bacterium]|nr:OsmC family protein [Gemmatimonadota bacterium]